VLEAVVLARMAAESPEPEKLIFADKKKRPTEALFLSWKNIFSGEDLQRTAGLATNCR